MLKLTCALGRGSKLPPGPKGGQSVGKRKFEDALRETKRAQELDPLSAIIADQVAWIYLLKNDLNSVLEHAQRNIELNPGFPGTQYLLGSAHLKQRRYEEATAAFQKAVELSGRASVWLSSLGYCYAVTGRRAHALNVAKELEARYAGTRLSDNIYPEVCWTWREGSVLCVAPKGFRAVERRVTAYYSQLRL
jgi:Flp pilus assembly protein TadD